MATLSEKHSLWSEIKFQLKSGVFIVRRYFVNKFLNVKKFKDNGKLRSYPIISISKSKLWNGNDNENNWILTAGKVQNLRLAAKKLNGVEIKANQVFSFWKHIGRPTTRKGFVIGREIKEGCIVPTIAGGICQLSNALYDAALKSNFQIIERHKHTKVIEGSLAEINRDATVKWNYVDLQFKSYNDFRIEVDVTKDELIVKFLGLVKDNVAFENEIFVPSKLNDCYSCGNLKCFKNPNENDKQKESPITTFILDQKWDEYDDYIKSNSNSNDFFILPFFKDKFIKLESYNWSISNTKNVKTVWFSATKRAILLRFLVNNQNNVFSLMLLLDKMMVKSISRLIPVASTHLVITQNLLPFLWEEGVLGGRTFDVLMNRLPVEILHKRLDMAKENFPESNTLDDFRASQTVVEMENRALTEARRIITPHREIADIFKNKSIKLNWASIVAAKNNEKGKKIFFPSSGLGKKGAYEVKKLAKELDLTIVLRKGVLESKDFWNGVKTEISHTQNFNDIGLVIYPIYTENQPRVLLQALARKIPIITTIAAGISESENITIIPIGDYIALKQAVEKWIKSF
jgi:VanW like protein